MEKTFGLNKTVNQVRKLYPHAWRDASNNSVWDGVNLDGRIGKFGKLISAHGWQTVDLNSATCGLCGLSLHNGWSHYVSSTGIYGNLLRCYIGTNIKNDSTSA